MKYDFDEGKKYEYMYASVCLYVCTHTYAK